MHADGHDNERGDKNSSKSFEGVGAMNGEGIECFWSHVNRSAVSAKEMPGHRSDVLDDHIVFHDWLKNAKLGEPIPSVRGTSTNTL